MIVNVKEYWTKALSHKIDVRIGNDDKTITYQEFMLYWILRFELNANKVYVDLDSAYSFYKDKWPDKKWDEMKASKYYGRVIFLPWDKVF